MIYDKLENIDYYINLSDDIRIGLLFLQKVSAEIEKGVYELSPNVRAIVFEYYSTKENKIGYEAHKDFIDIQYVIKGEEYVKYSPIERLKEVKPYERE